MTKERPFVTYLQSLREDRGALAALRRGLGQPPGTEREMYRYVVPWLPSEPRPQQESVHYLVAALFGYHPQGGGAGNLGRAFARTVAAGDNTTAVERRFTALLTAHVEDLPFYLRQAISFLKSKEVPVDWHQLFTDLMAWDHPDRYVQQQWARGFWARRREEDQNTTEEA
jgi:CRISPR system Cascade subunit CasB